MAGGGAKSGSRMKPQRPQPQEPLAATADEVFDKFPHLELVLSRHGQSMSNFYVMSVKSIIQEAKNKTVEENDGTPLQLFLEGIDPLPPGVDPFYTRYLPVVLSEVPKYKYIIQILPEFGAFVVVVKLGDYPQDLAGEDYTLDDHGRPVIPPLKLLFRFEDLYMMGYLSRNSRQWRVFSDVKLKGYISGVNINRHCRHLKFTSSYSGSDGLAVDFTKLMIGAEPLFRARSVLLNDTDRKQREIQLAMSVFCATLSEGTRRRVIYRKLVNTLRWGISQPLLEAAPSEEPPPVVTAPSPSQHEIASDPIHSWLQDCKSIMNGFSPSDQSLNKEELLKERSNHMKKCRDIAIAKLGKINSDDNSDDLAGED